MKPVIIIAIIAICVSAAGAGIFGYTQYTTDIEALQNQLAQEKKDAATKLKEEKYNAEVAAMRAAQEQHDAKVAVAKAEDAERVAIAQAKVDKYNAEVAAKNKLDAQEREQIQQNTKNNIKLEAQKSPLVKGMMNGGLTYWIEPVHSDSSSTVRDTISKFAAAIDGKYFNGVQLKRTFSEGGADITFNWVTDYNPSHIGRQVGDHLLVGLGGSTCGDWAPYTAVTVMQIMYHELGHAMGQGHSSDKSNIMYKSIDIQYEYDYKEKIVLSDGYWRSFGFCHPGEIFYETKAPTGSYEVYILPSGQDPTEFVSTIGGTYIPTCSGDNNQAYFSFSSGCNVGTGSKLVVYNPSNFGAGADVTIDVAIYDRNSPRYVNFNYIAGDRYYSDEYLQLVRSLFQ